MDWLASGGFAEWTGVGKTFRRMRMQAEVGKRGLLSEAQWQRMHDVFKGLPPLPKGRCRGNPRIALKPETERMQQRQLAGSIDNCGYRGLRGCLDRFWKMVSW